MIYSNAEWERKELKLLLCDPRAAMNINWMIIDHWSWKTAHNRSNNKIFNYIPDCNIWSISNPGNLIIRKDYRFWNGVVGVVLKSRLMILELRVSSDEFGWYRSLLEDPPCIQRFLRVVQMFNRFPDMIINPVSFSSHQILHIIFIFPHIIDRFDLIFQCSWFFFPFD